MKISPVNVAGPNPPLDEIVTIINNESSNVEACRNSYHPSIGIYSKIPDSLNTKHQVAICTLWFNSNAVFSLYWDNHRKNKTFKYEDYPHVNDFVDALLRYI